MPKKSKTDVPPATKSGEPKIPEWLQDGSFAAEEIRLYLWAASRCGLEVSHWARNMLNASARAILELDDGD